MKSKSKLIEIKNLKVEYNGEKVLDIDKFVIHAGERVGIVGENGAGKSTLLRTILGLEKIKTGEILFKGEEIRENILSWRRSLAMVFPENVLFSMSVEDNIRLWLKARGFSKEDINKQIKKYLEIFDITSIRHKKRDELSSGQAKRTYLACAFAIQPEILLLDEPFYYLDNEIKDKLLDNLKTILDRMNTTLIFVSHNLLELKRLCHRIMVLKGGKLF